MDEINPEKSCAEILELRTELIVLTSVVGILITGREVLLLGTHSNERAKIAALLDQALGQSRGRIQVVLELMEKVNQSALKTVEFLKAQPASEAKQ